MISSLQTGVTGLNQFQRKLEVIGNNIANVNTLGYKTGRTDFADTFSRSLNGTGASSTSQVGTGVGLSGVRTLFSQGTTVSNQSPTDLSIQGEGYFVVRDPVTNQTFATRAGNFHEDGGYLVTEAGMRVQGYSDSTLKTVGDVKIDKTGMPATSDPNAEVQKWSFGLDGKLTMSLTDGSQFVRGQVLLQQFKDPLALRKEGGNLYSGLDKAGKLDWSASPGLPNQKGMGAIQANSLEMSNVDLATEFTDMITAQRGYQANARTITTSDDILQELVNLKR